MSKRFVRFVASAVTSCALSFLAACGGGGGAAPNVQPGPTPCAAGFTGTAPNCVPLQPSTTASGKLVDDPSGTPLSGVPVKLQPWAAYPTPGPTPSALPSPQVITAADGSFSLGGVPNGDYLLVIGSESATDTVRPTIHDHVKLTGRAQVLVAPTLPVVPFYTPPPMETNGKYRLMTIDANNEAPCLQDFNAKRTALGLPPVVQDEWLTENVRAYTAAHANPGWATHTPPPYPYGFLTTGNTSVAGDSSCFGQVLGAFSDPNAANYAANRQTRWFAGEYYFYTPPALQSQGIGAIEYPIDPRVFADPNTFPWV